MDTVPRSSKTGVNASQHISSQPELSSKESKLIGASSAGIRALIFQFTNFYLRAPAKLFRPTRVDYMAITRLYLKDTPGYNVPRPYNFYKDSSFGVLISAIRKFGWRFVPDTILPPLIANSATGMVLYTSYLMSLQFFNDYKKNFLENPTPWDTFRAGFVAGTFQSLAAAPIDAIMMRSTASELIQGKHQNLWVFGLNKLKEIGITGVFAGLGLSFVKESIGFAAYFCSFETIKNQGYHLTKHSLMNLGYYKMKFFNPFEFQMGKDEYFKAVNEGKKYKILKTSFVFIAGMTASFSLLMIQYPLTKIQNIHLSRLEAFDLYNESQKIPKTGSRMVTIYFNTYLDTIEHVLFIQKNSKLTWFDWLYKGFRRQALSTIPATTLGLLVLEGLRNKLSVEVEVNPLSIERLNP